MDLKPENHLLSRTLMRVFDGLKSGGDAGMQWRDAARAVDAALADDEAVRDSDAGRAVRERDLEALEILVGGWRSGVPLPASDKLVLKRAMKALKKRLKLTRLDDESKLGGRAMTGGVRSEIVGVKPPEQYPAEVWEELLRQGRLRDGGHGLVEVL